MEVRSLYGLLKGRKMKLKDYKNLNDLVGRYFVKRNEQECIFKITEIVENTPYQLKVEEYWVPSDQISMNGYDPAYFAECEECEDFKLKKKYIIEIPEELVDVVINHEAFRELGIAFKKL
jgi:hypothetical protein